MEGIWGVISVGMSVRFSSRISLGLLGGESMSISAGESLAFSEDESMIWRGILY